MEWLSGSVMDPAYSARSVPSGKSARACRFLEPAEVLKNAACRSAQALQRLTSDGPAEPQRHFPGLTPLLFRQQQLHESAVARTTVRCPAAGKFGKRPAETGEKPDHKAVATALINN